MSFYKFLHTLTFDLILPKHCVGCQLEGVSLCAACASLIRETSVHTCPFCEAPSPAGRTCSRHEAAALRGCFSFGYYHDPLLQRALKEYKYRFALEVGALLANRLARAALAHRTIFPADPIVVPVPLTLRRRNQRGFNQALLFAEHVRRALELPLAPGVLRRVRHTYPQAKLPDNERRKNMRGAFRVTDPAAIRGRAILLIDDVLTTGATLEAAAEALKSAGATDIFGIVLAKG